MDALLDAALRCVGRGWFVFPCRPRTKEPAIAGGFKSASNLEGQIREWWGRWPDANVGIATGASGLCVLDIDHGIADAPALNEWTRGNGLPKTYTVRTGRTDGFGAQLYFAGRDFKSISWVAGDISGDIRCATGYVMAAGSVHPSGELYRDLERCDTAPVPEFVRGLKPELGASMADDGEPITTGRNNALTRIAGTLRNLGMGAEELTDSLAKINAIRCVPPLPQSEIESIASHAAAWKLPEAAPRVVLGRVPAPVSTEASTGLKTDLMEWRALFHTREETENTPDPEFLVGNFLQAESVTGIIGPARARKSIVALNIIHALLTGEPLFGHFEVLAKPERIVYLCPESGKKSLGRRLRNMGLARFVGDTLFYTSMNSDPVALDYPLLREAVRGSVLFIDTAVRFYDGDENSAEDMKRFGAQCHALIRDGVQAVILLHHTAKNADTITLESGRGSGDFGGFLTCCWGTTLDDFEDAYNAHSLMSCVKQRDFQADSFKLAPSGNQDDFFLQYVDGSENARVQVGAKAKAGKAKALAFIRAHPAMSGEALQRALADQGITYSVSSVRIMVRDVRGVQEVQVPAVRGAA